jgi:hypothetical protein
VAPPDSASMLAPYASPTCVSTVRSDHVRPVAPHFTQQLETAGGRILVPAEHAREVDRTPSAAANRRAIDNTRRAFLGTTSTLPNF